MSNSFIEQSLSDKIFNEAKNKNEKTLSLLKKMVNIDSYSKDKEGIERLHPILSSILTDIGFKVKSIEQTDYANQFVACFEASSNIKKSILLMGHLDTVFPPGTAKNRPFTIKEKEGVATGPGVADMKGGIATTLVALEILKEMNLLGLTHSIEVLFTGEEELGSPVSSAIIEETAKNALLCFNMEPGRPDGSVVVERKGSGHAKIKVIGKSAHSGVAFDQGASANVELAHKILELHSLNDSELGINVNSGIIKGGTHYNVVPAESSVDIHFAYKHLADGEMLLNRFKEISDKVSVPNTSSFFEGRIACLPMEQTVENKKLFNLVKNCAKQLNLDLNGTATGGASDAGRISASGVPVICAMGPVGGGYHTEYEYIELASLPERVALLALSILAASKGYS